MQQGNPLGHSAEIRVFVSYDREHDGDLYDDLARDASATGFEISARSESRGATDLWDECLHRGIREADQVIFLCGLHTDTAGRVGAELRITREENRPYLLLWGRRELMCTMPSTADAEDRMFSWTQEVLQHQMLLIQAFGSPPGRGNPQEPGEFG